MNNVKAKCSFTASLIISLLIIVNKKMKGSGIKRAK